MVHRINEKLKWTVCLWCGRFFYYNENSNSEYADRKFCNLNDNDRPSNRCAVAFHRSSDYVKEALKKAASIEVDRIKKLNEMPVAPTCESPATGRNYGAHYGRESKAKAKRLSETNYQSERDLNAKKDDVDFVILEKKNTKKLRS